MMVIIENDEVEEFLSSSSAQSIFHEFITTFAQRTVSDSMWSRIESTLDQSEELSLTVIGSGALAAGFIHAMNYIQKVNNGVVSSKASKGGKDTKESVMGPGIGCH